MPVVLLTPLRRVSAWDGCFSSCSLLGVGAAVLAVRSSKRKELERQAGRARAGQEARLRGHHRPRHGAAGPRRGPRRSRARQGHPRRLPAGARRLRVGEVLRRLHDQARGDHQRHQDPRRRPLRHRVRARPGGGSAAAGASARVLLRPASRDGRRGRALRTARRRRARRPGVRAGRRARQGRRRARHAVW